MINCFRPLSRYIGLYQNTIASATISFPFPSPLEVYRFISNSAIDTIKTLKGRFPSPLEVYRFISVFNSLLSFFKLLFPSPLEVYRFISIFVVHCHSCYLGFRPLSRYIGLYPHILCPRQLLETQDVGPTGNTIYIVPYDCRPIKA